MLNCFLALFYCPPRSCVNDTLFVAKYDFLFSSSAIVATLLSVVEQVKSNQTVYTGWPKKKVSHYRESSLNRIKNRQPG